MYSKNVHLDNKENGEDAAHSKYSGNNESNVVAPFTRGKTARAVVAYAHNMQDTQMVFAQRIPTLGAFHNAKAVALLLVAEGNIGSRVEER